MIEPVDSLEITVVIDNVTDSLSSTPKFVETEFAGAWRRGMKWLGGKCLCCAAHGLSCLITARTGTSSRSLLFDTGPDEWVFERNVVRLGLDLGKVDAMMLSHGHWDHAAAMPRALQMITSANGGKPVPTYMHPGMFGPRAIKWPDGRFMPMEDIPSESVLAGNGAQLIVTKEEQSALSGSFYISGEIARVTAFERGLPGQHQLNERGEWKPDELLMDERFVAVHIANKGLFVFTACSHAGLINVLTHASHRFPDIPIYGVLGGFHLAGATESIIPDTVEALGKFNLDVIAAAHCTGWRALGAMTKQFGDRVVPSAVGKTFLL
ncbi:beta-lactamase [Bradyrhizobium sp. CCBAU 11434]|uniref:MBL fold metallo-hydrolase n=1 Tax=Bradyrhizobium sp. CCBAU 11434 TaxID=1630885 RepID=UPI0023053AC0|nr:MBL fold metallo-hydrolase [Bradyrhizobium sp. CCBAU 11434]MDA9523866.1 beta-lactamase [Bradyrhizobium sp. CCBAU 11434]